MSSFDRRQFLQTTGSFTVLAAAAGTAVAARPNRPTAGPRAGGDIHALIFDVFGTLVDWRNGVAREAQRILQPLGYELNWLEFASAWRAEYQPGMEEIRAGRKPFAKLDVVHRGMLDRVLPKFGLENLEEPVLQELNLAWHRLDGWPDLRESMRRLHKHFLLAPCSNGNIALMVDLARRNRITWDAILGAEIARDYKPKLHVYQAAATALNLEYNQVMMVAAHSDDLKAAAQAGLRTAFIARPDEFGPNTGELKPTVPVDFSGSSLADLVTQLVG